MKSRPGVFHRTLKGSSREITSVREDIIDNRNCGIFFKESVCIRKKQRMFCFQSTETPPPQFLMCSSKFCVGAQRNICMSQLFKMAVPGIFETKISYPKIGFSNTNTFFAKFLNKFDCKHYNSRI